MTGDHEVEEASSIAGSDATEVARARPISWCLTDISVDDDEHDRRPQRRRYEEPLAVTLRKQILSIAESVLSQCAPRVSR